MNQAPSYKRMQDSFWVTTIEIKKSRKEGAR